MQGCPENGFTEKFGLSVRLSGGFEIVVVSKLHLVDERSESRLTTIRVRFYLDSLVMRREAFITDLEGR